MYSYALLSYEKKHLEQLIKTYVCISCDLTNADLRKKDLTRAKLSGSNLSNAKLSSSNLSYADLSFVNFTKGKAYIANFYKASLEGANLTEAKFNGANLSKDEVVSRGGNSSMIHIDWMIGSNEIDVDGISSDGTKTPVFRNGEWTS